MYAHAGHTQQFGKSGGSVLHRHICGKSNIGSPHQHLWCKSPPSPSRKTLAFILGKNSTTDVRELFRRFLSQM